MGRLRAAGVPGQTGRACRLLELHSGRLRCRAHRTEEPRQEAAEGTRELPVGTDQSTHCSRPGRPTWKAEGTCTTLTENRKRHKDLQRYEKFRHKLPGMKATISETKIHLIGSTTK